MALTYAYANLALNTLRGQTFSFPNIYLALLTGDPTPEGFQTSELSVGTYARQAITLAAPVSGVTSNTNIISFGTAGTSWGVVTYAALVNALTGGTMLAYEPVATTSILSGDEVRIGVGVLTFTLA